MCKVNCESQCHACKNKQDKNSKIQEIQLHFGKDRDEQKRGDDTEDHRNQQPVSGGDGDLPEG